VPVVTSANILLYPVRDLTIRSSTRITFSGSRPVIFLVFGNATIDGVIDVGARGPTPGPGGYASGAPAPSCATGNGGDGVGLSGGGGGGAARPGGNGGEVDGFRVGTGGGVQTSDVFAEFKFGGCAGGSSPPEVTATGAHGGGGGGALQLSVAGTLGGTGQILAGGGGGGAGASLDTAGFVLTFGERGNGSDGSSGRGAGGGGGGIGRFIHHAL
jgi:hypothetical protein